MPTTTISTTLLESVNVVLANLGESPVTTISGGSVLQQAQLALQTIEEVSSDVQSKGWWFNQKSGSVYSTTANIIIYPSNTGNEWSSSIPEEARRYITIRAARIAQTRFVGSEELQKFSYNEELVSLAILQQAHVRNSNGVLDFTSFPSELRSLGIEEVMFLQGTVEEKIGTLRLGGELATIAKTKAETALIADQERLVDQQVNTEVQNAIKVAAEAGLVTSQQALISQQVLDLVADIALKTKQGEKIDEEVDLLQTQDLLTSAQKDTELKNAIKVAAETGLVTAQQALVTQQVLDSVADVTLKGKQGALLDQQTLTEAEQATKVQEEVDLLEAQEVLVTNQAATELKKALDVVADITLKSKQGSLIDVQAATELKNALKVVAETSLINDQEALVVNQAATELKKALDIAADTTLKGKQGNLIDVQAATELKRALDLVADTTLKGKQGALIDAQELKTDAESALIASQTTTDASQRALIDAQELKTDAETTLVGSQTALTDAQELKTDAESALISSQTITDATQRTLIAAQELKTDAEKELIDAQELKTDAETLQVDAQTALLGSQKTQLDAQTAIEATAEKAFYDGVVAGTQDTYRDFAAEMRIMGIQESTFQQTPAYKKVELIKDAGKLRTATATETGADATELQEVNKIMRFIGEPPVTALNSNSLASEAVRLLRDTDLELQGRGWWFNTETDVTLTKTIEFIVSGIGGHWHGTYTYNSTTQRYEHVAGGHVHYFSKTDTNGSNTFGTWSLNGEDNGVYTETLDSNIGTGALPDPALFEQGTLVVNSFIEIPSNALSVEVDDYDTRIISDQGSRYLYDLVTKSYNSWSASSVDCKIIYKRDLNDVPYKYLEYLEVRVAILLTELYPQSGIDIQRLPKMEQELRAYFKDREADDANYSIFDNFDTASRIGVNRPYSIF